MCALARARARACVCVEVLPQCLKDAEAKFCVKHLDKVRNYVFKTILTNNLFLDGVSSLDVSPRCRILTNTGSRGDWDGEKRAGGGRGGGGGGGGVMV